MCHFMSFPWSKNKIARLTRLQPQTKLDSRPYINSAFIFATHLLQLQYWGIGFTRLDTGMSATDLSSGSRNKPFISKRRLED